MLVCAVNALPQGPRGGHPWRGEVIRIFKSQVTGRAQNFSFLPVDSQ